MYPPPEHGDSTCRVCGGRTFRDDRCVRCGVAPSPAPPAGIDDSRATLDTASSATPGRTAPSAAVAGQPFGERYFIVGQLGAGGAGQVFQAWDRVLGITVALKVLKVGEASDAAQESERRLIQELLVARSITHKNVVRIHDIGQADGVSYITMPFVKGGDLYSLLSRTGRLPISRALALARQIAAGLIAAHDAGIVHRDLKPGNILVDEEDRAVIVDFGIAHTANATISTMTAEGAIKGTVAYMAPEQALGTPVDARTDVYSFGLVLYEMLSGPRPTADTGSLQELIQRTKQPPAPVRSLNGQIPIALDAIVSRCLEPDPANRFQRTKDLAAALDSLDDHGYAPSAPLARDEPRPEPPVAPPVPESAPAPAVPRPRQRLRVAALLLVGVLGAGAAWFWTQSRESSPATPAAQRSLVVANFTNTTGEDVFDGTVEEALTIGLESASFLNAFSRREATRLAAIVAPKAPLDEQTARLVAIREGLDLVIGGRVETNADGYRLYVRGISPETGALVTESQRAVSTKDRVLEAIGELAKEVRRALGEVPLEASGQSTATGAPETFTAATLEAAHAYTEAQRLADSGRDNEAVEFYNQATTLDPNFGRAYSGLGVSYLRLGRLEDARTAWNKCLSLVDRMTERERYRTLGLYAQQMAGNYEQAIEHNRALVERYPGDSTGFNNLAVAYFMTLNFPSALEAGRQALALNARRTRYRANEALFAMYASDFNSARQAATQAISQDGTYFKAYLPLAMAAVDVGDAAAVAAAYDRMAKSGRSGASLAATGLADFDIYNDRIPEAIARLQPAIAADEEGKNAIGATNKYLALADAHVAAGKAADAVAAVDKALVASRRDIDLVAAARLLILADRQPLAAKLAAELNARLPTQSRAYGRLVDGWLAADAGRTTDAVVAFLESRKLADFWLARFSLGVAYVNAGAFGEALSELDSAQRRRGEAMAVFLDDVPTARYLSALPYWLGRAQEGLGQQAAATASYKRFLALRSDGSADPLAADARKRVN